MTFAVVACRLGAVLALALTMPATAEEGRLSSLPAPQTATVRVVFTPGDDVAGDIIQAIRSARKQVLVQSFSFTHYGIARALIEAHQRGVEVKLIADREQTENMRRGQVTGLLRAGVPVSLDGEHQSAHNKVMVIDTGRPEAVVITGSFNFTRAAQHKNAENVVFLSGNATVVRQYAANWQQHWAHSQPLVLH